MTKAVLLFEVGRSEPLYPLSPQVVREGLAQVKAAVEACPALAAMLHDSGQLQPGHRASSPIPAATSPG